jgi:hypothetical protein
MTARSAETAKNARRWFGALTGNAQPREEPTADRSGDPELVTPQTGSVRRCDGCGQPETWDEVYGWSPIETPHPDCLARTRVHGGAQA